MRESVKRTGPHAPVNLAFSQDDLGAFECRPVRLLSVGEPPAPGEEGQVEFYMAAGVQPVTYVRLLSPSVPEKEP